ncbi:MAG TPA: hypothetical protein VF977_14575 [Candidatus Binatia bacterium]|jgi:hypothetical protein
METFKKRQKAWARKEKQQKKAARKIERRNEKTKLADDKLQDVNSPTNNESEDQAAPTI